MQPVGRGLILATVSIALVACWQGYERGVAPGPVAEERPHDAGPKPQSWFRFEDGSGDVIDSGRTGRSGKAVGLERRAPGRVGNAARFPASAARAAYVVVDQPTSMADWTQLSVTAWVFLEDRGGFNLVGRYGGPGADPFIFGMLDRQLDVTLGYYPSCDGMTTWSDRSGTQIPLGVWTHVAFTLDLATHRIEFYIDGRRTFVDTVYPNNERFCERGSPLRIGPFMTEGAHPYSAVIDEVKIFDVVLDERRICTEGRCTSKRR
jgi:hypothetical protein